jgi:hypothetical protein
MGASHVGQVVGLRRRDREADRIDRADPGVSLDGQLKAAQVGGQHADVDIATSQVLQDGDVVEELRDDLHRDERRGVQLAHSGVEDLVEHLELLLGWDLGQGLDPVPGPALAYAH